MSRERTAQKDWEWVHRTKFERDDEQYFYFLDRCCDIVRMKRRVPRALTELIERTDLVPQRGYRYLLDGDRVGRLRSQRGLASKKLAAKIHSMNDKKRKSSELVCHAGIKKDDERFLYFVDRLGNIIRMERGVPRARTEVIFQSGLRRERGYMYFVNDNGDVVREPDKSR